MLYYHTAVRYLGSPVSEKKIPSAFERCISVDGDSAVEMRLEPAEVSEKAELSRTRASRSRILNKYLSF